MIMNLPKLSFIQRKKSFVRKTQHTGHDWILALQLFILVSLAGVGLSVYVFFSVSSQDGGTAPAPVGTNASKSIIDEELLQKTIKAYDDKEAQFKAYQESLPAAPAI